MSTPDKHRFVAGIAEKYGGRLKRYLRLRLTNSADVPDLAQEVFLSLLRVPNHEDIRSPEAYLFTVASHIVQQHHQRSVQSPAPLDWIERLGEIPLSSSDEPPAKIEIHQRMVLLERTLDEMPPRMAMALVMHRVAGHTIEEIARELKIAEITVKKDLAKALVRCRASAMERSDD